MAAGTYLPLAGLLLATAVTLATSAVPVAAGDRYSGRMVIIRAPGAARVLDVSAGRSALQQQRRRLVEDQVAPEFGGGVQLLGADDILNSKGLNPNRQVCLNGKCTQPGRPYTDRPCDSFHYCGH